MKQWKWGSSDPALDGKQPGNGLGGSDASRREFLSGLIAGGAASLLCSIKSVAQTAAAPGRIDVHHHMFPPFYVEAMEREVRASGFVFRPWTPSVSIEAMDRHGIAAAMLSPVQRLVLDSMSDRSERARDLTRRNNEYGAQLTKDYPGRFGLLAALPLPDREGSLKEIEYSFEVLKADGIALWTDYLDKWPGDPDFAPVFDELNRRKAVVFFHPARPICCRDLAGQSGILEYDIDTARAVDSLLLNGTFARCPNIRFIFSHSGGALTVLAARIIDDFPKKLSHLVPHGVEYELKRLYFEVAHASKPSALDALKDMVSASQILFGSDSPIRDYELTTDGLDRYAGFSASERKAINRGNAERLFPRFKV
jgi:predicted TIM-barrel fold metal-dependent hydrolase